MPAGCVSTTSAIRTPPGSWTTVAKSGIGYSVHPELNPGSWNDPALPNEHRLVDPRVPVVPGLEAGACEEVLLAKVSQRVGAAADGRHDGRRHLEQPADVLKVDERSVDCLDRYSNIKTTEAIRASEQPISSGSCNKRALEPVAAAFSASYVGQNPLPERTGSHGVRRVKVRVVVELLDQLWHRRLPTGGSPTAANRGTVGCGCQGCAHPLRATRSEQRHRPGRRRRRRWSPP